MITTTLWLLPAGCERREDQTRSAQAEDEQNALQDWDPLKLPYLGATRQHHKWYALLWLKGRVIRYLCGIIHKLPLYNQS